MPVKSCKSKYFMNRLTAVACVSTFVRFIVVLCKTITFWVSENKDLNGSFCFFSVST